MASGLHSGAPIFVVGATGTGKSAAAMELARAMGGADSAAILCMDAMQVYRGADIGTSKPTATERVEIPHGGLDLVEFAPAAGGRAFDVAHYLKHAGEFLREQRDAGRRVIIVGGTGLYFRALTRGLCEAPQGSEELRAELNGLSVVELRGRLEKIDAAMLERIDTSNPRRLARAIEVKEATGRSLREWQEETPEPLVPEFTAFWIQRGREELEQRIKARIEAMFAQGWVEEVRGLVEKYGTEAVRNFSAIGYREIAARRMTESASAGSGRRQAELILRQAQDDGSQQEEITEADPSGEPPLNRRLPGGGSSEIAAGNQDCRSSPSGLKGDIYMATRQYAKRQLTWFAREPNLQPVMLIGNQSLSAVLRVQ